MPARLSLLLDTGMVVAYIVLADRARGLARTGRNRTWSWWQAARLAMWLVLVGAVLDLAENVHLWTQADNLATSAPVTLSWEPWTTAMRAGLEVLGDRRDRRADRSEVGAAVLGQRGRRPSRIGCGAVVRRCPAYGNGWVARLRSSTPRSGCP